MTRECCHDPDIHEELHMKLVALRQIKALTLRVEPSMSHAPSLVSLPFPGRMVGSAEAALLEPLPAVPDRLAISSASALLRASSGSFSSSESLYTMQDKISDWLISSCAFVCFLWIHLPI